MKRIRLTAHAAAYVDRRGFTVAEVEEAIRNAPWEPAELGRLQCRMTFQFNNVWNGVHYASKDVSPIFVEEEEEIVVITVYTYYG